MADLLDQLSESFGDTYTIERELGGGGMSRVFLAREPGLNRRVVVKVLPPETAAEMSVERFTREIEVTAALQHPHILPILSAGKRGGLLYYVTPFVEGESLRDVLRREGALPIARAVALAREVAEALAQAHAKGVIHRDVKPENILLSAGHAILMDFGIARAVSSLGESLTATGVSLGTPTSMAPEQALGERAVDARADVYALGCVLFELLAGHPPYSGPTAQALIAQHLGAPIPSVRTFRSPVPRELDEVVQRALAKTPADRFESAETFRAALAPFAETRSPPSRTDAWRSPRRLMLIGAASVVLILTALSLRSFGSDRGAIAGGGEQSVAVLPFVNVERDTAQEYFADGMTDELAAALGSVPELRVAARTSTFSFKGKTDTPERIGRALHVRHLLEGSVRRAGAKVRVTAQLVNVSDGLSLWSQSFERDAGDVFAVQDEIAHAIVAALRVRLQESMRLASRHQTENMDAHDLYLRGRFLWNQATAASLNQALDCFHQALSKDSTYALAWAGIAATYTRLADAFMAPSEATPKALDAAHRAIALDSSIADAWATIAIASVSGRVDAVRTRDAFERALALNPSEIRAHYAKAFYWAVMNEPERSLAAAREAANLDPLSAFAALIASSMAIDANRADTALAYAQRAERLAPGFVYTESALGAAYAALGRTADAEQAYLRDEKALGHRSVGLAILYLQSGRRSEADAIISQVIAGMPKAYVGPDQIAAYFAASGDRTRMYEWLSRAVDAHSMSGLLQYRSIFSRFRNEKQFQDAAAQFGIQF